MVFGILLALVGAVWLGQGVGLIRGSFMTGSPFWGVTGLVCLLTGGGLAWFAARRPGSV